MQDAMGLGATDYDKLRATEQRLGRQIAAALRQFDRVRDASVLVSLPQQSSYAFGNNQQPAQATVMLTLNDINSPLTQSEASSIRSAVQMAVPALLPENISITDSAMNSYPVPSEDGVSSVYLGDQLELRRRAQELIQNQVYNILTPVFGYDSVRVTAAVELDFDKRTTQSVTYEPPGDQENLGIIVSLDQTATRVTGDGFLGGTVGFDPNGAATPMYPEGWTEAAGEDYYAYSQKINAEVNEVREQVEQQMGKFRSVNVSVLFDAGEEWDEAEARDDLLQAVARAVGVEDASVNLMRADFKEGELAPPPDPVDPTISFLGIPLTYWLIGLGIILLFVFLLIMMQRSAKKRRLAYEEQIARMEEEARLLEAQQFAQAQQEQIASALEEDDPVRVRLGEIQNLAAEKPEIVAQLLRNWLMDDFGR
jgi:flagellar M-ring protein FliF